MNSAGVTEPYSLSTPVTDRPGSSSQGLYSTLGRGFMSYTTTPAFSYRFHPKTSFCRESCACSSTVTRQASAAPSNQVERSRCSKMQATLAFRVMTCPLWISEGTSLSTPADLYRHFNLPSASVHFHTATFKRSLRCRSLSPTALTAKCAITAALRRSSCARGEGMYGNRSFIEALLGMLVCRQ